MTSEAMTGPSGEQLEALVQRRLHGQVRDLRLLVGDQGLILQGQSSTYYVKQLAQHAARDITGLTILANEIEVRRDPTLTNRVPENGSCFTNGPLTTSLSSTSSMPFELEKNHE